ncbi:MAG TPA: hypothetical protein EYP90_11125, partial [Chromatiaceae bacterium]|nr:hypothetical protein [Chromatiaceae bacterium]
MKESLNKPRISREKTCSRFAPVVGIMLSLVPGWAGAAEQLLFEAQKLDGQGWSLEAPRLSVEPGPADALRLGVHAPRLRLSQPPVAVEDLELSCPVFNLFEDGGSSCADGKLAFRLEPWKPVSGKMAWRHGEEGFELVVDLLAPGQGEIKGRLGGQERIQRLKLELIGLALEPFFKLLLPEWSGSGRLDASSALEKGKGTGWRVDGSLRASRFNFSDAEGLHVGEELAFSLSAEGQGLPDSPDGNFKVALHSGQLYIDPFYLEFSPEAPFSLEARIEGSLTEERWRLEQLAGSYGGVMGFQGSGHFFSGGLEQLRMTFDVPQLGRF